MAHPGALRTALTGVRVQPSRLGAATALLALVGAATGLRTRVLDVGYWIDEGLAVGIAAHPIADIPGLLAQDVPPPLY